MLLEKLLSTVLNVFFMEAGHDIRRFVADDLCNSDLEECVNMEVLARKAGFVKQSFQASKIGYLSCNNKSDWDSIDFTVLFDAYLCYTL